LLLSFARQNLIHGLVSGGKMFSKSSITVRAADAGRAQRAVALRILKK
jgi:hypothetical protein